MPFPPLDCFHRHSFVLILSLFYRSHDIAWPLSPAEELALVEARRGLSLNFLGLSEKSRSVVSVCIDLVAKKQHEAVLK